MAETAMADVPAAPALETDEYRRDLMVDLALEFAVRLNDQGFVDACNHEMSGREERFMEQFPNAALLVVCHSILVDFPMQRAPPKDAAVICSTIDRMLALEYEYGGFPQFQETLDRVCVQLFLVLFRQHPDQYDWIEQHAQELLLHERKVDVVADSLRAPLELVRDAESPLAAVADLEQRCPYNAAVQFVHSWLRSTVMKLDAPSRLEHLYDCLVGGDLSSGPEPNEAGSFHRAGDLNPSQEPEQDDPSIPNICLTLGAIRGAFAGSDKQFRAIWRQTNPKVLRFLKEGRVGV